jgi:hypothetical protein
MWLVWLVWLLCGCIGGTDRHPKMFDNIKCIASLNIFWKNPTPLVYSPSFYEATETFKQGLDIAQSYTSTDSKGPAHFVFDDIGWLALTQCLDQALLTLRNCHSSRKGDGGVRRSKDEGGSESSLDLNVRRAHSNLGYFRSLPSCGDNSNHLCVSVSLLFGDCACRGLASLKHITSALATRFITDRLLDSNAMHQLDLALDLDLVQCTGSLPPTTLVFATSFLEARAAWPSFCCIDCLTEQSPRMC